MTSEFLASLDTIHSELAIVWPKGREMSCCPNDGRHYTIKDFPRPVSIGQIESRLLYNLAVSGGVTRAIEIGTGFGYSSFWLGAGIARNSATIGWLGSLDDHSEGGIGRQGLDFAVSGAKRLGLDRVVDYFVGASPGDIHKYVCEPIDLALIDGSHKGTQPLDDYLALRAQLSGARFLVWHDVQAQYDVGEGLAAAIKDGWSPIVFPTSCRLCVCYRKVGEWDIALRAFERARTLSLL
jgi:hypothetical protein